MFARGGGRRHYLDPPIKWGAADGAELAEFERSEHRLVPWVFVLRFGNKKARAARARASNLNGQAAYLWQQLGQLPATAGARKPNPRMRRQSMVGSLIFYPAR
jgi:hypothetical protein